MSWGWGSEYGKVMYHSEQFPIHGMSSGEENGLALAIGELRGGTCVCRGGGRVCVTIDLEERWWFYCYFWSIGVRCHIKSWLYTCAVLMPLASQ